MEPGWRRTVVVGLIVALWLAGSGLLEVDDGGRFVDGVVLGLFVITTVVLVFVAHRITNLGVRFVVVLTAVAVVSAVFQLVDDGDVGWLGMALIATVLATLSVVPDRIARLRRSTSAG